MADEYLGKAVLELTANLAPLTAKLEEGKAEAEGMAKSTAGGFRGGISKAAVVAGAAVGGLVFGLDKSVKAAEDNQAAEAKLAAAFKASGQNIDKYKNQIDAAEQSSAGLGFKSEDVKAALAKLVVATGNGTQAIQALSTAQDIARFKGISLTDASQMLAQTMAGSTRAARTLGIQVVASSTASAKATSWYHAQTQALTQQYGSYSKLTAAQKQQYNAAYASLQQQYKQMSATASVTDKTNTAAKAIDIVNAKLHGQADAFAQTAQGAREKMGAEFQLLEINIGNVLIPVLTKVSLVLASFSEFLVKHATAVKLVIAVLGPLAVAILAIAAATKIWTAVQWLLNDSLLANPVVAIAAGVIALGLALYEAYTHSQTFRDIVLGAFHDVENAVGDVVAVGTDIVNAFGAVVTWFKDNWPEVATLLSGPFAPLVALATNGFGIRDKLIHAFDSILSSLKKAWGAIASGFKDVLSKIGSWFSGIGKIIAAPFDALINAATSGFGLVGAFKSAWDAISRDAGRIFHAVANAIVSVFKSPINAIIELIDAIKLPDGIHIKTWHGIPDGFSIDWTHPFNIPKLAEGGIVSSPTLAMIGEAGPEAVVPLSKGGGMGITVNVSGVVGNERDVAVKIGRELQRLKNRGLDFGLA